MKYVFSILIGTGILFALTIGYGVNTVSSNADYQKLFTEKQRSLIIGTSRAAKLEGNVVSEAYQRQSSIPTKTFNYAFNLGMSPYGPLYNQSIFDHVYQNGYDKSRLFVLCVDPWSISSYKTNLNQPDQFRESETKINFKSSTTFASAKYFLRYYKKPYFTLLFENNQVAKNEGDRPDEEFINKHLSAKVSRYRAEHLHNDVIDSVRIAALSDLIVELKQLGEVYLVKLPIAMEMIQLEKQYSTEFDSILSSLSQAHNTNLLDFYPFANSFLYPDGNHLWDEDAESVSAIIGEAIAMHQSGNLVASRNEILQSYSRYPTTNYGHLLAK